MSTTADIFLSYNREDAATANEAFRSSTLVNLAALSVRLGRKLKVKADASGFIDDDQANHLHTPALRGSWSI